MLHPPPAHCQTQWVGRSAALASVGRRLGPGVFTFIGPPGVGKTRFALELFQAAGYRGQWLWVDLALAVSERQVIRAIRAAAGIGGSNEPDVRKDTKNLVGALVARRYKYVVLDGFEGAKATSAWIPGELAASTDGLCVVVTSREPLADPRETRIAIAPLNADDAAALFQERARRLGMDGLDDEQVRTLVTHLDGLPLAIELAAGRAQVLGLPQVVERLGQGGLESTTGHPCLEDALRDSWAGLTKDERRTLRIVTCFDGAFEILAAEAVLGPEAHQRILQLHDRSLISVETLSQERRYRLLLPIASFVRRQRLEDDPAKDARHAHAGYYATLAQDINKKLESTDYVKTVRRLLPEAHNLQHAFRWCRKESCGGAGAIGLALDSVFEIRGWSQRDNLLTELIEECDMLGVADRVEALGRRAFVRSRTGRSEEAVSDLEQMRRLAITPACQRRLLFAQTAVGRRIFDNDGLVQLAERLDETDPTDDEEARCRGHADRLRACVAMNVSDVTMAVEHELSALRHFSRAGHGRLTNHSRLASAICLTFAGRLDEAKEHVTAALLAFRSTGHQRGEGLCLSVLGLIETHSDRFEVAIGHFKTAEGLHQEVGDWRGVHTVNYYTGVAELIRGNFETAEQHFLAASRGQFVAPPLAGAAAARAMRGDLEGARVLFVDVDAHLSNPENSRGNPEWQGVVRAFRLALVLADSECDFRSGRPDSGARGLREVANAQASPAVVRRFVQRLQTDAVFIGARFGTEPWAEDTLALGAEMAWARMPAGELVDLRKRGPLRKILSALAENYIEAQAEQGSALTTARLFTLGWPDEGASKAAANNRVRVALAELRKRGLRGWLERGATGYRLKPSLRLVWRDQT